MTGKLVSAKTRKRFLIDSMLSSIRPELSPRLSNRFNNTCSGHSKYKTNWQGTTCNTFNFSSLGREYLEEMWIKHPKKKTSTYSFFKFDSLVKLTWEAIDQETSLVLLLHSILHSVFQQNNGDFHGNDKAILDVALNEFTILGAFTLLFLTQKITSCGTSL